MSREFLTAAVLVAAAALTAGCRSDARPRAVVFLTDFGQADGAVSAMRGVAFGVEPRLVLEDLTHQIPPFDIWAAAYRLAQAAPYWPAGTVFVAVVDPGVGTDRRSIVLETSTGQYFVSPDNGTLTLVAEELGIVEVREIDESRHRRPGSSTSHTFHGRDVYALTGARLAAGAIDLAGVGPRRPPEVVAIPYQRPAFEGDRVVGTIPALDPAYGNVWTNIDRATFERLGPSIGQPVAVRILDGERLVYESSVPFASTFGDVPEGRPLLYFNSLERVALALNQGDFAAAHGVAAGPAWRVELSTP